MRKRNYNPMELRQLTGMSQQELASLLHVSRTSIAMHESIGRPLPATAHIYYVHLLAELQKQPAAKKDIVKTNGGHQQQFREELQFMIRQKRLEANILRRRLDKNAQKEQGRLQRQLLVPSMEKVQARLATDPKKAKTTAIISERHKKWLQLEQKYAHNDSLTEWYQVQQLKDQLKYNLLLREAEEAEKMLEILG